MAPIQRSRVEKARQFLAGGAVFREDSDDELGYEDHPWEWIYDEHGADDAQSEKNATPRKRKAARTSLGKRIVGARMGSFTCKVGDTVLLKAEGNYLEVVHDQGRGLVRRTLEGLLADLPAGQLVRLNRHQAVDPSTVQAWSGSGQRGLRLVLRDGTELSVSRRRSTEVVNRIRRTATMRVK